MAKRRKKRASEWLQTLRAAAALGEQEALEVALGLWLEDPAIAGNQPLPPARLEREVVPGGALLAQETVPRAFLETLTEHRLAAFRALAAAAWATRYLSGDDAAQKPLETLVKDARDEVRETLFRTLAAPSAPRTRLARLVGAWLPTGKSPSPRVQALALRLLPLLAETEEDALAALDTLERTRLQDHPLVDEAWVEALSALGRRFPQAVMRRFGKWLLSRPRWAPRIARVLARPWAADHATEALRLLEAMAHRWGQRRWITQALQALARESALPETEVEALWQKWLNEEETAS